MIKLIALLCVIGVALAFGIAATIGDVDANPVRFVQQSLGDENEADENERDSGDNENENENENENGD